MPQAKREEVVQDSDTHFTIAVKEPAERNMANRRVVILVAQYYKVLPRAVRIISGHHSPTKILSVDK